MLSTVAEEKRPL